MNIITNNPLFVSRDYREFDKPTVFRRHGNSFREKLWRIQRPSVRERQRNGQRD